MRIFCGLTGDATTIAAAVVNERGGVIATSEVTDDSFGYLALCRMWVRHTDILRVAVADLGDSRQLRRLAAAAGQPTAAAEGIEVGSEDPLDKAVHIARMLARGELVATIGTEEPTATCRLVGGLHTLARNAHAAHATMIELLRGTHPAALAAWGDPTETAALEVLRTAMGDAPGTETPVRGKAEPARVKELALALERNQRSRKYQLEPPVAAAIAATAEGVLAAERSCLALATGIDDQVGAAPQSRPASPPSRRVEPAAEASPPSGRRRAAEPAAAAPEPEPAATPEPPRPRRSASQTPPRSRRRAAEPKPQPPAPSRHAEQPTGQLPTRAPKAAPALPPDDLHDEPVTAPLRPHAERPSGDEGFPLMPEPPKYVEPATTASPTASATPPGPLTETDLLSAPVSELPTGLDEADDDDLLIFSQARSAWFKGPAAIEDVEEAWNFEADEGWRAAEAASDNRRNAAETTPSGLPRRVPQANLVPGSAILSDATPVPIVRDATALASRTAGFFRGWSRARRETVGAGTGS